MRYEKWMKELTKDMSLPPMEEKTVAFDELDRLMYGELDEEEFFSIQDRESMNKKNNKRTSR